MKKYNYRRLPKVWYVDVKDYNGDWRVDEFKTIFNRLSKRFNAFNQQYYGKNLNGKFVGRGYIGEFSYDFAIYHKLSLDTFFNLIS